MRAAPIVSGSLAVCLLVALTLLRARDPILAADERLEAARRTWPSWAADLGRALDWLGGHWWLPPVVAVAVVLAGRRRAWGPAVALVAASAGADLFLHAIKALVDSDRPGEGRTLPVAAAFPSGHATTALTIYAVLAVTATRRASRRAQRIALAVGVLLGLAVGAGRLLDGLRAGSDVLGGWLVGVAWLSLMLGIAHHRAAGRP